MLKKHELQVGIYFKYEGKVEIMTEATLLNYYQYPNDQRKYDGVFLKEAHLDLFEEFGRTEKDGVPCHFNGDNIMIFKRDGYFDIFMHSELNGNVHFVMRAFYLHQLQLFYAIVEGGPLTIKNISII